MEFLTNGFLSNELKVQMCNRQWKFKFRQYGPMYGRNTMTLLV